jgi:hypothetical protein
MAATSGKTIGLLALAGLACFVFGRALFGLLRGTPAPAAAGQSDAGAEEPAAETAGARTDVDLLAAYGSFVPGTAVAQPFAWVPAVAPPAPGGEVSTPAPDQPGEFRPVPLNVSLVLLAGRAARAVVDGQIVGIGDRVAAGSVRRITHAGIEVDASARTLFYELRRAWPRGYEPPAGPPAANEDKREPR